MNERKSFFDQIIELNPKRAYLVTEKGINFRKHYVFMTRDATQEFLNVRIGYYTNLPISEERPYIGQHWHGYDANRDEVDIYLDGVDGGDWLATLDTYKKIAQSVVDEVVQKYDDVYEQIEVLRQKGFGRKELYVFGYSDDDISHSIILHTKE